MQTGNTISTQSEAKPGWDRRRESRGRVGRRADSVSH